MDSIIALAFVLSSSFYYVLEVKYIDVMKVGNGFRLCWDGIGLREQSHLNIEITASTCCLPSLDLGKNSIMQETLQRQFHLKTTSR